MAYTKKNIFSYLDELKKELQDYILLDQDILKLISVDNGRPLEAEDIEDIYGLVDKNIFFRPKEVDTVLEQKCSLMVCLSGITQGKDMMGATIEFIVVCHYDLFNLDDGNTRVFQLLSKIHDHLGNARGSWMGELELYGFNDMINIKSGYYGFSARYKLSQIKW